MSSTDDATLHAQQLIRFIRDEIPLARAMDLQLAGCDDGHLALHAPLPPNVNDKGCAFGGSLVSLMTLSGWALVELALRRRELDCDVFVAESTVRYLTPLWRDFRSEARLAAEADWATFFSTIEARGKARIGVDCVVPDEVGAPACTLGARFVAKRRG
ncbi:MULTISPECIES: YiiD C-terminal domain-containing protein [Rhodanobacter]|uniref:YiiD C-terminal domain-containing protein n=1 Tax=Rhodanobacter TaxID=75309 RepID=UPI00040482FA|nr:MULTISPECIES: YiiD C-terminal domain-containing protein [Rhodanobacter]TAN17572.1 MAG: thioesterase [Rhodanobacter sp.]UJJ55113.1 thioesterase domain-containing protein [Rhodanobacter thiooxydans]